ncbi:40-residue YVTN family beta-propeller repeat-containing protein [Bryocella elongata]|uniref:40-residue YVTN family beta-propeller repeat-containing protein n=1 Tax=Bryocella elongata TaxID=863522 RepID=A0A1H5SJL8_9BACT|nr:cytochrome D1 domain-containing protein [Bryocella elongata]SEF49957.1 40-residue YVTN family beta-propeller repeat-containing protein [Bryocella elongata]
MRLGFVVSAALSVASLLPICPSAAGQASSGTLLAISKKDHMVSIVDGTTFAIRGKVATGEDPHEVTASPDGRKAWISNYGFGQYHSLRQIDIPTAKVDKVIDLGALTGPHGLDFQGGEVWFTAEAAKAFGRYDPATGKIDFILGTGQDRTHMIYVWPNGEHIATTNVNAATVSLIDLKHVRVPAPAAPGAPGSGPTMVDRSDWEQTVIPVGKGDEGFDVSPDGRQLWTADAQDGTVSVIDLATKKNIATLPLDVAGANRLKFTPDGRFAIISLLRGSTIVIVDTKTHLRVKTIEMGGGSAGVVIDAAGNRAFIACGGGNYVGVLDLKTFTIVKKIDVGGDPDGMVWIPGR